MISKREATKKAAKYQVPTNSKEFVKLPSVEVLCAYIEMNNLEVVGWRGDLLVVRRAKVNVTDETVPLVEGS